MIKAHAREVWGHAPPDKFWISNLLRSFLVLDVLLLNLVVVFEARVIKGVTPFWVAEAAKERENKRSHTDSTSPSPAAEGATHE